MRMHGLVADYVRLAHNVWRYFIFLQILMGHGVATAGTVWANGRAWDMAGARVYSEKNWGQSFPKKWWWLQANLFEHEPDLTLTALGAQRYIAGFYEEEIGMIAVHLKGEMYEFSNWSSRQLSWSVAPWGSWEASARSRTGYAVSVFAETTDRGALVLGPSRSGMVYDVRDAAYGRLVLRLTDPRGRVILDGMVSHSAQVEVGGGPWDKMWTCSVKPLSHPLRGIINFGARKVKTSL